LAIIEAFVVNKIYGPDPEKALPLITAGLSNEEIRTRTRQTVGVREVNFAVEAGEIFVIMGLSGSGKSTLLRCVNCLQRITSGRIIVAGQDLGQLKTQDLNRFRREKLAMVFQSFALLPYKSVLENVAFGLEIQKIPPAVRLEKAREAIHLVGLDGWENAYPDNLSGGMQQRVGIARALAQDADILLMDEPFSALDPLIRQDMQDELMAIQRKLHKTILFITHDLDEALKLGDRIALMKDGEIVQLGQTEDILLSPENEYVERFVRNVDRSKALTTASVMIKPRTVIYPKDGPKVALREMDNYGVSGLFVVDKDGILLGHLSADQAAELYERKARDLADNMEYDLARVSPDTPLCDVLETMAVAKLPVAVVDETGYLQGVLVRGAVLAGLAGSNPDPRDLAEVT
jgi:glycine betaine/proline transport system ATP-binding protein